MTTRRLNYRLLAVLLVALALGAGGVFGLHAWQGRRHAHTLMARARQAEAEGRPGRAATCWQRYLEFAPEDNAARAHYGELLEQLATSPHESWRAVTVYEEVLRREPARHDVRRRLAVLAVRLGWFVEGRQNLEVLLRDEPGQADLEVLLGRCQEEAGDYAAALVAYQNAVRHAPDRADAYLRLAGLLRYRLDQPEKVGPVLDDLVRHNADSAVAYLARAVHRTDQGSPAEAGRDIERALALAPDDAGVLRTAAQLARRRGDADEARRCLRRACERHPNDPDPYLALAAVELEHERKAEAIACLREGLRALPGRPDLMHLLAEALIEHGDEAEAEEVIHRLSRPGAPPGLAHYLTGRLRMRRREWLPAVRMLEEVLRSPDAAPALAGRAGLALARCHEMLGEGDRRLAALREAVARDGDTPATRLALASALGERGRVEEAVEQCREAMQRPQAPDEGLVLLARLLVRRNRALPPRVRRWGEVERVLGRAGRLPPLAAAVAVLRADMLAEQDRPDEALALLEKAVTEHPGDAGLAAALAEHALRRGRPGRAARILASTPADPKSAVRLCESRVALCVARASPASGQTLRKLEDEASRLPADGQNDLLRQIAAAYFQVGEAAEGRRLGRLLAGRTPDDLAARLPLLELALEGGDEELLAEAVADVRRLEGEDGTWWRYGEAGRLLLRARRGDAAGLDRAGELIAEVARARPDWARAALVEAYVRELRGDAAGAAGAYLRAFRGGERRPGLAEHLVGQLADEGRLDDADEVIRTSQQQQAPSPPLARVGAEIALRQHRGDRARELARLAVPADANDPEQLVWLGQVLALAGRQGEAEDALRRAVRLGGGRAEPWLALIAHLARGEHVPEAEAVRDEMRRRLPVAQLPLALAVSAEVLGRLDVAADQYRQALERVPHDYVVLQRAAAFHLRFGHAAPAEALLRRLLAPQVNVPEANRAWARRRLALLLAYPERGETSEEGAAQALALLDENARRKQETLLDRRARLLVEAARGPERPAALRRLEESGKAQPFAAEELVCLVRLHEAAGDEGAANERMLDLLGLDRNNPEYLARHIDRLLRHGRKDDARPWLARLRKLEPDSSRVQAFRAGLLQPTAQ